MRSSIAIFALCYGGIVFANPGVTKDTDIGKRKVELHYQVTKCGVTLLGEEVCSINTVTRFDKKISKKKISNGECVVSEVDNVRAAHCRMTTGVKKKKKVVAKKVRKNRIQIHGGYGTNGLDVDETNNVTKVEEDRGVLAGLQYTRVITEEFNIGAAVFTNKTFTITFGLDY